MTFRARHKPEVGSLTVFMAVFAVALFALVGLVVDAGRAIAAQSAAYAQAEQAARAGAGQLSVEALRSGQIALDPQAAIEAANAYLAAIGERGSTSVTGGVVTVKIQEVEPTVILQIIGIDKISVSAMASATNVHGVTRPD
ncbi:MAG: pilus assembly protein TadG-related protein [Nitrososphaerales archaeon]